MSGNQPKTPRKPATKFANLRKKMELQKLERQKTARQKMERQKVRTGKPSK